MPKIALSSFRSTKNIVPVNIIKSAFPMSKLRSNTTNAIKTIQTEAKR
jgi:hypothetical protein